MNGMLRSASRVALAAGLVVGLVACGDDDDDGGDDASATTTTGGEEASGGEFCDALLEFNEAVFQVDTEGLTDEEAAAAGEELVPLIEAVEGSAPSALGDTATEIADAVRSLAEGDATDFDSDETFFAYTGFVSDAVGECGFEAIDVTAVDYGFEGVPTSVPAGTVAINLANEGEEEHEFVLFKVADDETRSTAELLEDPTVQEQGPGEFLTAAFAPPGESGATIAELEAGRYIALCFVPVGGGEDGPPHYTEGMVADLTVE